MEGSTIPLMKKPASLMEVGPNGNNLAAGAAVRHPVDRLQRARRENQGPDLDFVRHVYGSGLAMRLATEQRLAAEHERASALPSPGLHRDILTGQDGQLDFSDFMSLPENRPDLKEPNPHSSMERQLGMY